MFGRERIPPPRRTYARSGYPLVHVITIFVRLVRPGGVGLKERTPIETMQSKGANLKSYRWQRHRRGLYQTPIAA